MKRFMDKDFLLTTETAKEIYAKVKDMPIFDYHCHLSPKEIWENREPQNITQIWLYGDHYKWRAMRSFGIDEKYITGDATDYEKFMAYASIVPACVGNPLYHWTHLELQRYFHIHAPLCEKNADMIWQKTGRIIKEGGFTPRALIQASHVYALCTTDDPTDDLTYHKLLRDDAGFPVKVLPSFRPDKALGIDKPAFSPWLARLEQLADKPISSFSELKAVLAERIAYFDGLGCVASDHAFEYVPCAEASEEELEYIFQNRGGTREQVDRYQTALLRFLAEAYHKYGWAMEIHIGALRNNNSAFYRALGPDVGFDSVADHSIAAELSRFLDSMGDRLPKTILFNLNPKDNYVLGTMLGNFQSSDTACKIQFGSAWWFNDHLDGMRRQMTDLANLGVLGKFIGMLTDSRSFLSYPRHEYFRRLLAQILGNWVEEGEYPADLDMLCKIAQDIAFNNAKTYFEV